MSDDVALLNLETGNFGLVTMRLIDDAGTGVGDLVEVTFATNVSTECSTPSRPTLGTTELPPAT